MRENNLNILNKADLVDLFCALGVLKDQAMMTDDDAEAVRIFHHMEAIEAQLKSRKGDQRRALLALYDHRNACVQLTAAKATLAVAPVEARRKIENIAEGQYMHYSGDAGMCLEMLDSGRFVPD
jgi:Domain of unknown function (DUF2019)